VATQRVFKDADESSDFDRDVDTDSVKSRIGCLKYHAKAGHNHWHVLDFARYSLVSEDDGSVVDGRKAGFCLLDSETPFAFDPGPSFYGGGSCSFGNPHTPPALMGISVGWADEYGMNTAGQFVDITGLEPGTYCLRSEADPLNQITESADANNVAEARVQLDPDRLRVTRLPGACRLP